MMEDTEEEAQDTGSFDVKVGDGTETTSVDVPSPNVGGTGAKGFVDVGTGLMDVSPETKGSVGA